MDEVIDHREVGRQLASIEGVNLDSASLATLRLWDARGLALMALARGDKVEAEKVTRRDRSTPSARRTCSITYSGAAVSR